MKTIIEYDRYELAVVIRRPEVKIEVPEEVEVNPTRIFLLEFQALGRNVKAPIRPLTQEDYGIARRLLSKYDQKTLLEHAWTFWHAFRELVIEKPDIPVMRLFHSRLGDIEKGGL